jgi:hypothetical protein
VAEALFRMEGERFVPSADACNGWGPGLVHGGPIAGLFARAIEREAADPALLIARLTVDLFKAVPQVPLQVACRTVRRGRRIQAVEASLIADGVEASRAHATLLRPTPVEVADCNLPPPLPYPGPEGIPEGRVIDLYRSGGDNERVRPAVAHGFHAVGRARGIRVDRTRGIGTAWLRLPLPLVEGEEPTPLVRLATLSDFASGLGLVPLAGPYSFINADITIYLQRLPIGEWVCFDSMGSALPAGTSLAEAHLMDGDGTFGRVLMVRIANERKPAGES